MAKPPSFHSTWSPFQYAIFRVLWVTALISNIGSWMHEVSAAWLMTTLTHQPLLVALIQATTASAVCLFAIPAGALADIVDKRRQLILLQTGMMLVAGLLAFCSFLDKITPLSLLVLTFCLGVGVAFNAPAWQSLVPELVPKKDLVQAITLNSMGVNCSRAIGPALAGFVIASLGPAYVFAFNAVSFLGIIIALYQWKREATISTLPAERFLGAMKLGIRYIKSSPIIKIVFIKSISIFFFVSCVWALLPLIAKLLLHKGAVEYGVLLGLLGAGAVVGAILTPSIRALLSIDKLVLTGALTFSGAMLILIIYPHFYLACLSFFIIGIGWISVLSILNATVQQSVPPWVRARAMSVYLMTFYGSMAVGGALWGLLANHFGIAFSIFIAGIGVLIASLIAYYFPLSKIIIDDHTPTMDSPPPPVKVTLNHEAGPVMVTVEYLVAPEKVEPFAKAMQELRLARLREGAFSWTLFKDVNHPNRFIECFISESWLEHLRSHERVSITDRKIQNQVNAFCQTAKPVITHFVAYSFKKERKRWRH